MQQNCKKSLLLQHFLIGVSLTAKKELQKLNRRELVDIIYAFQQNEKKLNGKVASLERALEKTKSEPAPAQMEADPGDPEKEPALMYGDPEENLVSEVQSAKGPVEQPAKEPKDIALPSEEAVQDERRRLTRGRALRRVLLTTVCFLIVIAAATVLIVTLFMPVLQISGDSMEPTISDGDIVLLMKTEDLEVGDLCGFYWNNKLLVKRVIGTPGDVIKMDPQGNVYVNDVMLDESYISEKAFGDSCDIEFPYHVPDNHYFLVGDARDISMDSRNSMIGAVAGEQVVGKVILRVWPDIEHF